MQPGRRDPNYTVASGLAQNDWSVEVWAETRTGRYGVAG
jgi:hypothetical protein